jgi:hypothetical protein
MSDPDLALHRVEQVFARRRRAAMNGGEAGR